MSTLKEQMDDSLNRCDECGSPLDVTDQQQKCLNGDHEPVPGMERFVLACRIQDATSGYHDFGGVRICRHCKTFYATVQP